MRKFITDKRTGLRYELVGDYYLIAGEDEPEQEQEPIGIGASDCILYMEPVRRMAALAARDRYMVDHSSRLIAVYDERSRIHSGTWRALCYAREKKLDIRQIRWMKYL